MSRRPCRDSVAAVAAYSQVLWTQNMLMPWLWRHVRGKSEGDGRSPKRPRLAAVVS